MVRYRVPGLLANSLTALGLGFTERGIGIRVYRARPRSKPSDPSQTPQPKPLRPSSSQLCFAWEFQHIAELLVLFSITRTVFHISIVGITNCFFVLASLCCIISCSYADFRFSLSFLFLLCAFNNTKKFASSKRGTSKQRERERERERER